MQQPDISTSARSFQLIRTHTQHRRAMADLPSPACEPTNSRFCPANDFHARKSATAWPPGLRAVPASSELASLPMVPSSAAALAHAPIPPALRSPPHHASTHSGTRPHLASESLPPLTHPRSTSHIADHQLKRNRQSFWDIPSTHFISELTLHR
jgi:hypothetical protein